MCTALAKSIRSGYELTVITNDSYSPKINCTPNSESFIMSLPNKCALLGYEWLHVLAEKIYPCGVYN